MPTTGSNRSSKVAVVTDSAAALSSELIAEHKLYVARMEITIDGETYVDGPNGDLVDFYSQLAESSEVPTTSAPRPSEYLERFRAAAERSDHIFCVSLSAKLSAAYDSALVAAELFEKERPGTTVSVFDSETAASSEALIVLAAARVAAEGGSLEEVEAVAGAVAGKVRLLAILDTLHYIHRSGRVPKIAVWATNALNIKPVMEYSVGNVGAIARPRSTRRALERIQKEMLVDLSGEVAHVNVMHAGAPDRAEELRGWASGKLDCAELFVSEFHPFMGAHTGPGLVGASWWAE
ncbi:MAG: DegV family protein [Chloroflexi bacterium]|nr:DegV family protein [Chloroflexota bacterium]